jgi:hypothetical protein
MSKNKIAILILIVGIVALTAYFIGQQLMGKGNMQPVEVKSARRLSSDIVEPSPSIFNDNAINPTVQITISDNNQTPIGN